MRRYAWALAVLTALWASAASAAETPKSIPWVETGPFKHVDGSGPHRLSHQLLMDQRARRLSARPTVSQDVGDVAVMVDNGRIFIQPRPGSPFDLATPTNLTFTPAGGGFSVAFATAAFDPDPGSPLPLTDDDTEPVALPFSFPFLGTSYSTVHVNSDGNVTFGAGDSSSDPRDAARLVGGSPRVAPLLNDLNVEDGGSISASVRTNELVVTWKDVPEFGITNKNTFQVTLKSSGEIVFAYQSIDADFGVVGVAEGNDQGPINEIDLTTALPTTRDAGAIFEEFLPPILVKQMNVLEAAREFYKTHPDKFDFLVFFEDSVLDIGFGAFAFNAGIKNQTSGLGLPLYDDSSVVGSAGELESLVQMNNIGLYWPDAGKMVDPPIKKFRFFCLKPGGVGAPCGATLDGPPGSDQLSRRARWFGTLNGDFGAHGAYTLGLNSAMSIMGQEAGHRWLAFPGFVHPTKGVGFDSFDLLGRGFAHWSFFFNVRVPDEQFGGDPRASSAEGNAIADLGSAASAGLPVPCTRPGESTFLTERNELIDGYTELDQHLMGLRHGWEVGPFWYVDEARSAFSGRALDGFFPSGLRDFDAQDDRIFCGKRVNLTLGDIQAFEGPRNPEIGDEVDTDASGNPHADVKTMAFILVVDADSPRAEAHATAIGQVDTFRRTWQTYANGRATGGRGLFDTSLNPPVH